MWANPNWQILSAKVHPCGKLELYWTPHKDIHPQEVGASMCCYLRTEENKCQVLLHISHTAIPSNLSLLNHVKSLRISQDLSSNPAIPAFSAIWTICGKQAATQKGGQSACNRFGHQLQSPPQSRLETYQDIRPHRLGSQNLASTRYLHDRTRGEGNVLSRGPLKV